MDWVAAAVRLDRVVVLPPVQWHPASGLGYRASARSQIHLSGRLAGRRWDGIADCDRLDRRDLQLDRLKMTATRMRSPLGRALGLGSAKEGVEHWWLQRITAAALVPLSVWFIIAIIRLVGADIETVRDWVSTPMPAILL